MNFSKKDIIYFSVGGVIIILLVFLLVRTYHVEENSISNPTPEVTTNEQVNIPDIEIEEGTYYKEDTPKKEENKVTSDKNSNKTESKPATSEPVKEEVKEEVNVPNEVTYSAKDVKVINTLNETLESVENTKITSSFKDSAKATFITIVDFLFYDGTINGITFKELTESGKEKVLEIASKIDSAIEKKIPGYKETIASGANKVFLKMSDLIKKGANNINDFLYNNLSEDDYNLVISSKDELILYTKGAVSFIKGAGGSLFDITKDKLHNWYQNFKNN